MCEACGDRQYAPDDGSSSCRTCSWPLATLKNSSSTSCDACVENYYWSAADDAVCADEQCPEFCSACLGPCWIRNRVASTLAGSEVARIEDDQNGSRRRRGFEVDYPRAIDNIHLQESAKTRAQARTATTVRTPASPSRP